MPTRPERFHIDSAMQMLSTVADVGVELAGVGVDVTLLLSGVTEIRKDLDELVQQCYKVVDEFTLPGSSSVIAACESCRNPVLPVPPIDESFNTVPKLGPSTERAITNLNAMSFLGIQSCSVHCEEVKKWLQVVSAEKSASNAFNDSYDLDRFIE